MKYTTTPFVGTFHDVGIAQHRKASACRQFTPEMGLECCHSVHISIGCRSYTVDSARRDTTLPFGIVSCSIDVLSAIAL
jgi:hypothetical protein